MASDVGICCGVDGVQGRVGSQLSSRLSPFITRLTQNAAQNSPSRQEKQLKPVGVGAHSDVLEDDAEKNPSPIPSSTRQHPSRRLGEGDGEDSTFEHSAPEYPMPDVDPGIATPELTEATCRCEPGCDTP